MKKLLTPMAAAAALLISAGAATAQSPNENWTLGWAFLLNDEGDIACPDVAGVSPQGAVPNDGICTLTGNITDDIRLRAGLTYHLDGPVFIGTDVGADGNGGDPAILTIDSGVEVLGATGQSFLAIQRGSQIFVNGTAQDPVTMSSVGWQNENLSTTTATWGGLVINGRAPLNTGLEAAGEGDSGLFGGNVMDDDSGDIRYLRVIFAGFRVNADDELNGIAFQGVGSGGNYQFIQSHNGQDDGIEFFGGKAQVKNLIVTGAGDDSIDWTDGWQGRIQFFIIHQNADHPEGADRGIEGDNLGEDNDATPRSSPMLANGTLIGAAPNVGDTGILLREGTAGNFYNLVVANFVDASLDLDQDATYVQANQGNLVMQSTLLGNTTPASALEDDDDDTMNTPTLQNFFNNGANNTIAAPTLQQPAGGGKLYVNGATENGVTATDPSMADAFFDSVDYIGGVENDAGNWADGWPVWLND